ncbi:Auxin efflux carrier family protein [Quillaja saponaria]|uniref:Auxin efflux carrier family protein n=1 Tax=Quillaja saponaria TaxID=32244 RepID=A0AAD7L9L8_QUISA|nr:Auxin efflux carrier family protein [Quillaja saponaria]
MKFMSIFIVSLMANLKLLLLTGVGSFIALDGFGIFGEEARKNMNIISFFVFNPALVASKLAKTITFKSLVMLWFMPFNVLISFIIGSIFGWIILKMIKVPHILRGLVLGSCAAGNLGNILFILIPAVCKERSSPFGATDICNTSGLAYASLSMALGSVYLWLYVYNMVRVAVSQRSDVSNLEKETEAANNNTHTESAPKSPENISKHSYTTSPPPLLPPNSAEMCSQSQDNMDKLELGHQLKPECTMAIIALDEMLKKQTLVEKIQLHIKDIATKYLNLKTLFAPSTVAAIIGTIIGIVPPFRKLMIGDSAPLRVIDDSVSLLGDAAVPTITLIVGANLLKGVRKSSLKLSLIISIIVVRYILLPIIGIFVVKAAIHLGLIGRSKSLYQFVLLLQFTTPPAMQIGTITQLFGVGESECSVIFLATYAVAPVALTLWSTLFLWLVA